MIGLLGKKVGMTQIFDHDGNRVPVTVLEVGPCTIVQIKKKETDGYQAIQLAFDAKKEKRTNRAELGHFKKSKSTPKRFLREIRTENLEGLELGKELHVNNFAVGDYIDVIGTSIGKGFQGVVKRHHFKGGERGHGSMFGRVAGSIGASSFPSRVVKGMRMPGQMGNERVTVQNLRVEKIDLEHNLMAVHGAVPGHENSYLIIREALKKPRPRKWRFPGEPLEELKLPEKKVSTGKVKKAEATPKKKPAQAAPAKKK
ncbi:MAG: 50S ribosomal protein L3 [Omnitrophica bacterium RIFCSPHIGHO2_02_FULL_46_11]|nr:MAG: 50S ribosomal protein L3 [Omnitrophica bacterium RIFCSPHIGHO2_02_FULL_46_11]OGW86999.1 MAG: 50S ribosomal protein L3 [Omnitrophica bacterium RIFCSPLOWO2_01_FULL_45_10b]